MRVELHQRTTAALEAHLRQRSFPGAWQLPNWSLAIRIVVLCTALSVTLAGGLTAMGYVRAAGGLRQQAESALTADARQVAQVVDSWNAQRLADLKVAASMPTVRRPLETGAVATPADLNVAQDVLNNLDAVVQDVDSVALLDLSGTFILSSSLEDAGYNVAWRDYFREALKDRPFTSGITTSVVTNKPQIFHAMAVRGANGNLVGVVRSRASVEKIEQVVGAAQDRVGRGARGVLLDDHGLVIASTVDPTWQFRPVIPLSGQTSAALLQSRQWGAQLQPEPLGITDLAQVVGVRDRTTFTWRVTGTEYLAVALPLGETRWVYVVALPVATFEAAARTFLRDAVLTALFGVLVAFQLAMLFSRRLASSWTSLRKLEQARDEAEEARQRYKSLFERHPDAVFALDLHGSLMSANAAYERLSGASPPDHTAPSFHSLIVPGDVARTIEYLRRAAQGEPQSYETAMTSHHGDHAGRRLELHVTALPIVVGDAIVGVYGIAKDITERAHAEVQLRTTVAELAKQYRHAARAQSETRAVLDAANEAMLLLSPDLHVQMINERCSQLLDLAAAEVVGRRFDELQSVVERCFADPAQVRSLVARAVANPIQEFQEDLVQRWPQSRDLELYSTPVQGEAGQHLGRLYVFRDVTREREVDRMKSEFISLVSHELRTPLTSIKGYVDLLLDGEVGQLAEEQHEFLTIVKHNADREVKLINDLLDISRIEAGKVELLCTSLHLSRLIQEVADSLRPQIDAKQQHLSLQLDRTLPMVWADGDRITQVLANLVGNAHKYTPAGGSITICARSDGRGQVRVDVHDTGIGLSPEEQSQVFEKFFRAKNRTTQEVGGTGLGLAITRTLVELHGGHISVTSAPGQGATFSVILAIDDRAVVAATPDDDTRRGVCTVPMAS